MNRTKHTIGLLLLLGSLLLSACTGSQLSNSSDLQPVNLSTTSTETTVAADTAVSPTLIETTAAIATSSDIRAQQQAFIDLYNRVNPSVVSIQLRNSQGSGFIYNEAGYIVTNNHVVTNGGPIVVVFADGSEKEATLIGTDPDSDLAVLKVDAAPGDLTAVPIANSDTLQVGQLVIAIGNPFGQANSMTTGIISALGRLLPTNQTGGYNIPAMVQTDAAINPGNSGGPLLDIDGQVVGVNSAILSPVQGSSGVGYAIPANLVQVVVPQLIETGRVQHPWLGISGIELNIDINEQFGLEPTTRGVLIATVSDSGPAGSAGLRGSTNARAGDIIVGVDGRSVQDFDDLLAYILQNTTVGQTITVDILRDGQPEAISLTLKARPASG